jgi:DNA-directed RNA polymerase specialized sigma24 family protein
VSADLPRALRALCGLSHSAYIVKLRFFAGLANAEAAAALGISQATADRHWSYARDWLLREMQGE